MTRILLADDQQVVRQALRCLLEREPDLHVVGETSDGLEILALVAQLEPDVLITDVATPGGDPVALSQRLVRERGAAAPSATLSSTRTSPTCCGPCARPVVPGVTAPFAYCDACLVLRVECSLAEMTGVLGELADGDAVLARTRRACYGCGRTLEISALRDRRAERLAASKVSAALLRDRPLDVPDVPCLARKRGKTEPFILSRK